MPAPQEQSYRYIIPFAELIGFLILHAVLPLPTFIEQALCITVVGLTLATVSRPVLDFRVTNWVGTLFLGIVVFLIWIGPDTLFPGYRSHWLFTNSLMGSVKAGIPEGERSNLTTLILRALKASVIVPIAEELFWRAWMMRWLINPKLDQVSLGTWSPQAFWLVAILFASEHGSFWEVGLIAGVLYNWWMIRTKSLGSLIVAHGITNACLSLYAVFGNHWEYWG